MIVFNCFLLRATPDWGSLPRGVALSPCRVFLRNDVVELMVVNIAVVFVVRANVAVALKIL